MPTNHHYSAYCHFCLNESLNLILGSSYYYDDMIHNGKIFKINDEDFTKNYIIFLIIILL